MRGWSSLFGGLLMLILLAAGLWMLNLDEMVRASIAAGHLLDWITGGICLIWLLVILKVPWDLYFQAHAVAFEFEKSKELGILPAAGREAYVRELRARLGWLAVGAHLGSAALVAGIARYTGGQVGYWFAVFYLVSTVFRPAGAGYAYLARKLRDILHEVKYPREDVVELRCRVDQLDEAAKSMAIQLDGARERLAGESGARQQETKELRQSISALGREFVATISRLTDNQEVIRGIQAFVRLVTQSAGGS